MQRSQFLVERERTFPVGSVLYVEGDKALECFLIKEGSVRLTRRVQAIERNLRILRSGELFGEEALRGAPRKSSAEALSELVVLTLDRSSLSELFSTKENVDFMWKVIDPLIDRLRDVEEQLENAMIQDHPSRVLNTLIRLAENHSSPGQIVFSISPLELSSRVGLDVDTVKQTVQSLRNSGYVRIEEEKIVVPKLESLRRLYKLLELKEEVRGVNS